MAGPAGAERVTDGAEMPSLTGRTLGAYRVVTELGEGGMGTVWFGEHQRIGRRVAIKVLHPHLSSQPEPVARFVREARAVNEIRHPNIVEVTDFGEKDGLIYLVMELLEGETLGARLERQGRLSLATALHVARQIALALSAAHERGVVHRDLKPENVFLCAHDDYPDHVKVLDFGIAKLAAGASPGLGDERTRPGLILGTPTYMSPEQCAGDRDVDHRSDQYSLALVLYEMLTGAPPFTGSVGEVLASHAREIPVPARERDAAIPEGVSRALARALAKAPDRRFSTVKELVAALSAPPSERPPSPTPAEPASEARRAVERRQSAAVGHELAGILRRRFAHDRVELPSIPGVASECLRMLEHEDADLGAVARTLERDPLLVSRVMRIVNSASLGGRGAIDSVPRAVSRLGIKRIRAILREQSVRHVFRSRDAKIRRTFQQLWEHCVAVGTLARGVAQRIERAPDPDLAYLAGLLHDVGKPIVGTYLLDAERQLLDSLGKSWMAESVWLQVVESSHRVAGLSLARRWDMPAEIVALMEREERYYPAEGASCGNLVRYANALARVEGIDAGRIDVEEALETLLEGREVLGVDEGLEEELTRRLRSSEPPEPPDRMPVESTGPTRRWS
jgi:putative nucleotidyltransferase with HDIG domain